MCFYSKKIKSLSTCHIYLFIWMIFILRNEIMLPWCDRPAGVGEIFLFETKEYERKYFFFCSVSALYLFLFFYSCVLIVFLFRISSAWDLVLCLVERFYHIGELSHGLKNVPSSVILVFLNFFFGSHQFGTRVLLKDFITLEDYLTKKKIENVPSLVIFSYQFAT